MKKLLLIAAILAMVVSLASGPGLYAAADKHEKFMKSSIDLFQKDISTWQILKDQAKGSIKYRLDDSIFDFSLKGDGLKPGIEYTLLYCSNPYFWTELSILGADTATRGGVLKVKGSVSVDEGFMYNIDRGMALFLVLSDDLEDINNGIWLNRSAYLYSSNFNGFWPPD